MSISGCGGNILPGILDPAWPLLKPKSSSEVGWDMEPRGECAVWDCSASLKGLVGSVLPGVPKTSLASSAVEGLGSLDLACA